jgi:hypothetical protein
MDNECHGAIDMVTYGPERPILSPLGLGESRVYKQKISFGGHLAIPNPMNNQLKNNYLELF